MRSSGFQPFNGGLDEVRLWNVVRTQSQVQAAMLSELTGTEPGLAAYWRFNEGTGATVADDSPSNHTATLYNTTTWMGGGPLGTSGGDVTPPDITGVTTSNLTASSVTISFATNEVATGWVSYTGASCPCSDVYSAGTGHGARRHAHGADCGHDVSVPGQGHRRGWQPASGDDLECPHTGIGR